MIVDDSIVARTAFTRMIHDPVHRRVVASVGTAERALEELATNPADVILLDLEMPGMGGLEALPRIQRLAPDTQVLVVSSLAAEGARQTLTALAMGAADTMAKPVSGAFDDHYRDTLIARITALGPVRGVRPPADPEPHRAANPSTLPPSILAIGASTGGIHAIGQFLNHLPAWLDVPIIITQHLPANFMDVFAQQIGQLSGRETLLGTQGSSVLPGRIIIADAGGHAVVENTRSGVAIAIDRTPVASNCMPSADPMFASIAAVYGKRAGGVVLSGMGRDGCSGARDIFAAGGRIYAQDAATSAVWGMPGAVVTAGLSSATQPPAQLAQTIARLYPHPLARGDADNANDARIRQRVTA